MAARHAIRTKELATENIAKNLLTPGHDLPYTSLDYYDDTSKMEFQAQVISCFELKDLSISSLNLSNEVADVPTHAVILDKTLFYPEGGGQMSDFGTLTNGKTVDVLDSRIEDGIVLHLTNGELENGSVTGYLNAARRNQIMDHHTSVHIVGGSARKILGPHIWQAGSNKGERYARLDVTHYERLTRSQLDEIEDHANEIIQSDTSVEKLVLDRVDADARFGFDLYQGGPPKHQQIRVIKIGDHDVQACGGTHHDKIGKIGELRIIRSSAVQDGVERLQIVAGETAREHARTQERLLSEASDVLGVQTDELPATVQRFFDEWKNQKKQIENLEAEIVRLRTSGSGNDSIEKDGIRYAIMQSSGDMRQLLGMAQELTREPGKPTVAILGSREGGGILLVAMTEDSAASKSHNAIEILNSISKHIGGGGGGKPTFAQGGGNNPEGLDDALKAARDLLNL